MQLVPEKVQRFFVRHSVDALQCSSFDGRQYEEYDGPMSQLPRSVQLVELRQSSAVIGLHESPFNPQEPFSLQYWLFLQSASVVAMQEYPFLSEWHRPETSHALRYPVLQSRSRDEMRFALRP
jgi:hypothetical protein